MKISAFDCIPYYTTREIPEGWPLAPRFYEPDIGGDSYECLLERLELMEEVGFDWVSLSEHHYARTHMAPSPVVSAAYVAARLRRMKVAVLGPILPLNNPVRVAEELAMLDNLTRGRLVVGLMRGTPNEYQVFGVNPKEAREKTTEGVELVLRAWTEPEPFGWEGRYFHYRTVSIWPRPFQQPMPPTYALGTSTESSQLAARLHLGLGMSFGSTQGNSRVAAYYREQCALNGWQPKPEQIIFRCHVIVGETDREAVELAKRYPQTTAFRLRPAVNREVQTSDPRNFLGAPTLGLAVAAETVLEVDGDKHSVPVNFAGSPDTIVKQVERAKEAIGMGVMDFWFWDAFRSDQNQIMRSLKLFGKEVLPRIKEL